MFCHFDVLTVLTRGTDTWYYYTVKKKNSLFIRNSHIICSNIFQLFTSHHQAKFVKTQKV